MAHKLEDLSKDGRQELALALHLLKDFKSRGKLDVEITKQCIDLAKMLGVEEEFSDLYKVIPPAHEIFKSSIKGFPR